MTPIWQDVAWWAIKVFLAMGVALIIGTAIGFALALIGPDADAESDLDDDGWGW